jgi:2-C-methyl-D-erythritol 4-phosphate cytidylyltransferase/2-C-methyl-D-erythritol 2,4-cyclodiphosphate synthase
MKNLVLIVAGGNSARFGGDIPKQYSKINGKTVLRWSIDAFLQNDLIDDVLVVINKNHMSLYEDSTRDINILPPVIGGNTRQESVFLGLQRLEELNPQNILIHDAARPMVSTNLIADVIKKLDDYDAVDVALSISDTIKYQNDGILEVLNRDKAYMTQTPQGFRFATIMQLHKIAQGEYTDDISLCIHGNVDVGKVVGEQANIKITTQDDLKYFKFMIKEDKIYRTGFGIDVHRLSEPMSHDVMIKICGIDVSHNQSIIAHSDGDVGFHAITEALLGAMSLGNIGQLFPPTDNAYKGMDSEYFLVYARDELRKLSCAIVNIDVTIICEKPKIMPHSKQMRQNIAKILEIDESQVSVKATTTEKMGFLGEQKGIAAQAICMVTV